MKSSLDFKKIIGWNYILVFIKERYVISIKIFFVIFIIWYNNFVDFFFICFVFIMGIGDVIILIF